MGSDGMSGFGMGFGWMGVLIWVVIILLAAVLIKYLFSGRDG